MFAFSRGETGCNSYPKNISTKSRIPAQSMRTINLRYWSYRDCVATLTILGNGTTTIGEKKQTQIQVMIRADQKRFVRKFRAVIGGNTQPFHIFARNWRRLSTTSRLDQDCQQQTLKIFLLVLSCASRNRRTFAASCNATFLCRVQCLVA